MFESNQVATLNAQTSNQMIKFENEELDASLRTMLDENGEPLFCLKDLCVALVIKNSSDLKTRLSKGVAKTYPLQTKGGIQYTMFVNEQGFYQVIFQSNKSEAKKFQDWVFSEILPSIRKHGGYLTPQKTEQLLMNPDLIIELATSLKKEREQKQLLLMENNKQKEIIQEQEPLVNFANQVIADDETYTITDVWKLIGSKMKQQDFFQKCRDIGLITKSNHPVADAIRTGLVVKCIGTASTGYEYIQTRITGKGIKHICEKLKTGTKIIF